MKDGTLCSTEYDGFKPKDKEIGLLNKISVEHTQGQQVPEIKAIKSPSIY